MAFEIRMYDNEGDTKKLLMTERNGENEAEAAEAAGVRRAHRNEGGSINSWQSVT